MSFWVTLLILLVIFNAIPIFLQQLTKLTSEYDQLLNEFENSRIREAELQKRVDELRLGSESVNAKSLQNVQLMEKELEIVREENKMLCDANEKLVQKFVSYVVIHFLFVFFFQNSKFQLKLWSQC